MPAAPLLKVSALSSHGTDSMADSATHGRKLLETHFDLIQHKLHLLSRRSGLPAFEAEELCSWALYRLVEDDYRILGSWEGRSSFPTFLRVVLVNLMRDYRIHVWGKWRPSAAARRRGPASVLLEQLIVRDGLSEAEAVERLQTVHGLIPVPGDLERLAAALPWRSQRRRVSEEELLHLPVDGQVEILVEEKERASTAARIQELLVPLLQSLSSEERLLLRLSFFDGLSMATISPALGRPQRELYKMRERCLMMIRRSLADAGLGSEQARSLIGQVQGNLGLEAHLGI